MNLAIVAFTGLLMTCNQQDAATSGGSPVAKSKAPVEYGKVQWGRKLEPALSASQASGKPVVLCFQEVPG